MYREGESRRDRKTGNTTRKTVFAAAVCVWQHCFDQQVLIPVRAALCFAVPRFLPSGGSAGAHAGRAPKSGHVRRRPQPQAFLEAHRQGACVPRLASLPPLAFGVGAVMCSFAHPLHTAYACPRSFTEVHLSVVFIVHTYRTCSES